MRTRAALAAGVGLMTVAPAACGVIDLDFYVLGIGGAGGGGGLGTGGMGTGGAGTGGQCVPGVAPGSTVWSSGYADSGPQTAQSVAVDADGNIIVAGNLVGSVDFGCGPLVAVTGPSVFVAKLDPSGACTWSKEFTSSSSVDVYGVAIDPSGNVVLTGTFIGSIAFGGSTSTLTSGASGSAFVVKLSASGAPVWSESFGASSFGGSVATDATGDVLVTGLFDGSIVFGGVTFAASAEGSTFVVKLDPNGAVVWGQGFGTAGSSDGSGIAVDPSGNVFITGAFGGLADFGCGTLSDPKLLGGAFVVKLDATTGTCSWSRALLSTHGLGASLAVDAAANVVVTGRFGAGFIDFGSGDVPSAGGAEDLFLAKLGGPSGATLWGKVFGLSGGTHGTGVAVAGDGMVFVTGYTNGTVDFGEGMLTSAGGDDVLVASFDPAGNYRWAKRFGDAQDQEAQGIAVDPSSTHVIVVGGFEGTLDFACAPLVSTGNEEAFVAAFVR
jgi:Beta-propeller repeat